ncbi:2-hydroxyacid dehydrogenase, partial [Paenibacillus koleovorans]|uniref:2-hydroxyacid dehydrogenase n=1 Tax=Paenibacillus koleovorans TaxID=121608 RepID=UPI0013E3027F
LQRAPRLKAISTMGVGTNHFDVAAMKRHGILGTNTPDVLDETVADLVIALMLGTARRVAELDRYVKDGLWRKDDREKLFGTDVHHATLGIVGLGRIGEAIARRAVYGFSMEVLYYNRNRKPEAEERLGIRYAPLESLLGQSDFIAVMVPLTSETSQLIGREQFGQMKPGAIFINASRGQTVDEDALVDALTSGRLRAAGLDVFREEPPARENPLLQMPNVLTLPHIGSATFSTRL